VPSAAEMTFITVEFVAGSRICTTASPSGSGGAGGTCDWRIVPESEEPPASSATPSVVVTPLTTWIHDPSLNERETLLGLARAQDGWSDRAEGDVDAPALLVDNEAEAGHRDHHRVACADLGKAARAAKPAPAGPDDQLIGSDRGLLRAGEKRIPGQRAFAAGAASQDHFGVVRRQHRKGIPSGRGGPKVAAHRAAVADLWRSDGA